MNERMKSLGDDDIYISYVAFIIDSLSPLLVIYIEL